MRGWKVDSGNCSRRIPFVLVPYEGLEAHGAVAAPRRTLVLVPYEGLEGGKVERETALEIRGGPL